MTCLRRGDGEWLWNAAAWRAWRAGLVLMLLWICLVVTCNAQSGSEAPEYKIKAAFVCKFASYVEWPAQAFAQRDSPIVIGVMATDAVVDELTRTAAGLSVDGRSLVVRRLHRGEPLTNAHLIFIASSEEGRLADAVTTLKGQPVLLVTESSHAAASGSMINFVVVDDKVRFDIAPQAAELSRLRISARLLGVARLVIGKVS